MNFNTENMIELLDNLSDGHIRYAIGPGLGKVSHLSRTSPAEINNLDCSGFTQYVVYKTTEHRVRIPQGSKRQEDWLVGNDYTRINYSDEAFKLDNTVRIAFRARTPDLVRHVWLVINGKTYESTTRNRRNGPTSFDWFERESAADSCYFLGSIPNFLIGRVIHGL